MRITRSRFRLVRISVLLLAALLLPLPAVAQERSGRAPATPGALLRSAATVTQAVVKSETRLRSANAARVRAQSTPGTASGSFFKKPAGIAVIAIMVAGTGYALYSAKHDRITGINR